MGSVSPIRREPVEMHARALDNLGYIRRTMERAGSFTAVPGVGAVVMGTTAVVPITTAVGAAVVAARQEAPLAWLAVWLGEAVVAMTIGALGSAWKSHRARMPLLSGPGRKFLLGFVPPLVVGAVLSAALFQAGMSPMLPGVWLLLYGTAVFTGGAASVRVVPVMGLAFVAMGTLALFAPAAWGDAILAGGFGGVHIVFGIIIKVKYGG